MTTAALKDNPCHMDCPRRSGDCHADCQDYLAYAAMLGEQKKEQRKDWPSRDYAWDRGTRASRKRRRKK